MISRSRSAPTAAAMSIECTTSANSTVTCLYSADFAAVDTAAPHSKQNFAFCGSSIPHDEHTNPVAVMALLQPTRYAPRSQAISPWRDSDRDGHDMRRRLRGLGPIARACATAICRG